MVRNQILNEFFGHINEKQPTSHKIRRCDEIISVMIKYLNGDNEILTNERISKIKDYALSILCYDRKEFKCKKSDDIINQMNQYGFGDGKMKSVIYSKEKNECRLYFNNITHYVSKKGDNNGIENEDVIFCFTDVEDFIFEGKFDTSNIMNNRILENRNYLTEDGMHLFEFLSVIGYDYFIIRLKYRDVTKVEREQIDNLLDT